MSAVGSTTAQIVVNPALEPIKDRIICAADVRKEFDWALINGVRRVTEIRYSSAIVNAQLGQTALLTKVFTYDGGPGFDLAHIQETLTVV